MRFDAGVLEIAVSGERLPESAPQSANMVGLMVRSNPVEGALSDIRDASFPLTDLEVEERAAIMARQMAGLPVASVSRKDQAREVNLFTKAFERQGAEVRDFHYVSEARDWLRRVIAERRARKTGT